jgi:anti-anti-sigma regulatory factor
VLRLRREDRGTRKVILIVEGRIVGEWADLLEDVCLDRIRAGFSVVLDLSGVVFIGRQGIAALDRLVRIGTRITRCPPLIADLLEEEGVRIGRRSRDEDLSERVIPWKCRDGSDA